MCFAILVYFDFGYVCVKYVCSGYPWNWAVSCAVSRKYIHKHATFLRYRTIACENNNKLVNTKVVNRLETICFKSGYLLVLGPSLLFGEPSLAKLFDKASRAELFSEKASWAELFAFKTKPNRAFGFPKLSYFWLFSVEFFKEYNFLDEKAHFYWCLQDYTLKNWQKCWKSAHFLFLKVTQFFKW